jgi:HUS1 checkpoint protein
MKFGAKLIDTNSINHFTNVLSTLAKICAKTTEKTCIMELTPDKMQFKHADMLSINPTNTKSTFWLTIDPAKLFDVYICEGKSNDENYILLEIQPDTLHKALKINQQVKSVRIRLSKQQQMPCLKVEIDIQSLSKFNSRTITHEIVVNVLSSNSYSLDAPDINESFLSIQLPNIKLLKHIIERLKCLSDHIQLKANKNGELIFKVDTDSVNVSMYFKDLDVPNKNHSACKVRLNNKKFYDFINSLQFQPHKLYCNFSNQKYAHFSVHNDDLVFQYLIAGSL